MSFDLHGTEPIVRMRELNATVAHLRQHLDSKPVDASAAVERLLSGPAFRVVDSLLDEDGTAAQTTARAKLMHDLRTQKSEALRTADRLRGEREALLATPTADAPRRLGELDAGIAKHTETAERAHAVVE